MGALDLPESFIEKEEAPPALSAAHRERDAALATCLHAAARGDGDAFGRFYDATVSRARTAARRILRDPDAEDVVAEVFFEAWRNAARFDASRGTALAWLLCMIRSRSLDLKRRYVVRPSVGNRDMEYGDDLADPAPDPLERLNRSRQDAELHGAITRLSTTERWMVGLAYFRDLSHSEIAFSTGLPLGTVKSHLLRVQHKLRAALIPSHVSGACSPPP